MAVTVSEIRPVAHLPLILGMLRKLEVAALIDKRLPPYPGNVFSCGRGVEALVLAILDGSHALYKVGTRLEERGMIPLLQTGLERESLNDYRLGQILDALFAANLNQVLSVLTLKALEVYAIPMPWIHQDTTTIALYGAYESSHIRRVQAKQFACAADAEAAIGEYAGHKQGQRGRQPRLWRYHTLRTRVLNGQDPQLGERPAHKEDCVVLGGIHPRPAIRDHGAAKVQRFRLRIACQAHIERRISLRRRAPIACGVTRRARGRQGYCARSQELLDLGLQPVLAALIRAMQRRRQHGLPSLLPKALPASWRPWAERHRRPARHVRPAPHTWRQHHRRGLPHSG